jgi:hypothetical protein
MNELLRRGGVLVPLALAAVVAACSGAGTGSSGAPTGESGPPGAWKTITDSTGTCRVSAPPDWMIGSDFGLGPTELVPVVSGGPRIPAHGVSAWPSFASPAPGTSIQLFQKRVVVVSGEKACAVWRIKHGSEFTAGEAATMNRVGATLEVVKP